MRIGFFFDAQRPDGGMYQYAVVMLRVLYNHDLVNDYIVFHYGDIPADIKETDRWKFVRLKLNNNQSYNKTLHEEAFKKIKTTLKQNFGNCHSARKIAHYVRNMPLRADIRKFKPDFMIYPSPSAKSFLTGIPYITTIHDLQHKINPDFSKECGIEVLQERAYRYKNITKTAQLMFVDSQIGKEDVENFYNVPSDRLLILPTLAQINHLALKHTTSEDVLKKYGLKNNYLFYPAQLWIHKNHRLIVKAMNLLMSKYKITLTSVFTGSKQGEYDNIISLAGRLGVLNQIVFLGYVPDEDIRGLYQAAFALVMPTYLGPTNIPVYEAWSAGCPVITSDIRGIREQVGGAGLLVDPDSPAQLSDAIYTLIHNKQLKENLISRGYKKLNTYTEKEYAGILLSAIEKFKKQKDSSIPTNCKFSS
jgi:glycosyltransferase involved in cell wall biosynthesis